MAYVYKVKSEEEKQQIIVYIKNKKLPELTDSKKISNLKRCVNHNSYRQRAL